MRIERLKLEDLLTLFPDGFVGRVFWFHDISDEQAYIDRVVVGFYDEESAKTYTGTVQLYAPMGQDVRAFKEHLNTVWADAVVFARLMKNDKAGGFPILSAATPDELTAFAK